MAWSPKGLKPNHKKILRFYLMGMQVKEIAEKVELTPQQVSNVIHTPVFQQLYLEYQADLDARFEQAEIEAEMTDPVRELFKKEALPSAQKLVAIRDKETVKDETCRQTCLDILAQAGYRPVQETKLEANFNLNKQITDGLQKALVDLASSDSDYEDCVERGVEEGDVGVSGEQAEDTETSAG